MYPNEPKPITYDNAQDFMRKLNRLIDLKIEQKTSSYKQSCEEEIIVLTRDLTNYLLVTDPRKGIYVKGSND